MLRRSGLFSFLFTSNPVYTMHSAATERSIITAYWQRYCIISNVCHYYCVMLGIDDSDKYMIHRQNDGDQFLRKEGKIIFFPHTAS